MSKKFILILTTLLLLVPIQLEARHLLGGYMSYECLGGGDYKVSMRLYRDCNCTECADLDTVASIAIYNCNWSNCPNLFLADPFEVLYIPITRRQLLDRPAGFCSENGSDTLCVEEGLYEFTLSEYNVLLPPSEQDYYISYQRCCRSATVTDIVAPEETGMTLFVRITPDAYASCNSSVQVDIPPMFSTCVQELVQFNIPFENPDGDSIAIGFCAPYSGGGPNLKPDEFNRCFGGKPDPPCPPPYYPVRFRQPQLPGNFLELELDINLDSNLIEITGLPETIGRYTIGLCIQEYKKEGLVGETPVQLETVVRSSGVTPNTNLENKQAIKMYPNPAGLGQLTIEWPGSKKEAIIQLFSSEGKLLNVLGAQSSIITLDTDHLSSGIYFLKFISGTQMYTQKLSVLK